MAGEVSVIRSFVSVLILEYYKKGCSFGEGLIWDVTLDNIRWCDYAPNVS